MCANSSVKSGKNDSLNCFVNSECLVTTKDTVESTGYNTWHVLPVQVIYTMYNIHCIFVLQIPGIYLLYIIPVVYYTCCIFLRLAIESTQLVII